MGRLPHPEQLTRTRRKRSIAKTVRQNTSQMAEPIEEICKPTSFTPAGGSFADTGIVRNPVVPGHHLVARKASPAPRIRTSVQKKSKSKNAVPVVPSPHDLSADAIPSESAVARLETLGLVTSGIAHDFRNIVQAIQGGVHMIRHALAHGDIERVRNLADMMEQAASRGGDLTGRILDLVRRQGNGTAEDGGTDPAQAIADAALLLGSAVAPTHLLQVEVSDNLPPRVIAKRAELEAAIINVVMNARDAMQKGGNICIEAAADYDPPGLAPGAYVRIAVRDTGRGMDPRTIARATEPFFTTKGASNGTGLGLSSAQNVAHAAGGRLAIESQRRRGTTVTLWLRASSS